MRPHRRNSRGLAEIVGTLMLVVIVVAAATAFAFFVASYQKQVQAEETLNHDRALESVKVIGFTGTQCSAVSPLTCRPDSATPSPGFAVLNVTVASLDVIPISITGLFVDQHPVINYTAWLAAGPTDPCFNSSDAANNTNVTYGVFPCHALTLPAYGKATLSFNFDATNSSNSGPPAVCPTHNPICVPCPSSLAQSCAGYFALGVPSTATAPSADIQLDILTALGNAFAVSFAPSVPLISIFFVSDGLASVPVFDGLGSYQPVEADNASLATYDWIVLAIGGAAPPGSDCGNSGIYSGGEFECGGLALGGSYTVSLEVTNTDGMVGSASITYTAPS